MQKPDADVYARHPLTLRSWSRGRVTREPTRGRIKRGESVYRREREELRYFSNLRDAEYLREPLDQGCIDLRRVTAAGAKERKRGEARNRYREQFTPRYRTRPTFFFFFLLKIRSKAEHTEKIYSRIIVEEDYLFFRQLAD